MIYREIQTKEPYDLSPHGHAFINPYSGCSMGCPFCFWLDKEGWEGNIAAKMNIAEVLNETLKKWPKNELLYMGSICDPFNELEGKYHLSEQCLRVIHNYEIPLLITTSAVTDAVVEVADTIKNMNSRVIIVVELARIPEIQKMQQGGVHNGILHANQLQEKGLEVWATVSPICPGIIELKPFIEQLNQDIPIYIDSLRCDSGSVPEKRVLQWIQKDYPNLLEQYQKIVLEKDVSYFEKLLEQYKGNERIRTFPYQLDL